jgi:hypothetical protein
MSFGGVFCAPNIFTKRLQLNNNRCNILPNNLYSGDYVRQLLAQCVIKVQDNFHFTHSSVF